MRKTSHWDPKLQRMVPGPAPRKTQSGDGYLFSDRLYSDNPFMGKDGKVINSRKKHREYMARHNLTTMDDFKGTWDKAAKERAKHYTDGSGDKRARREAVERAIHKLER